jgi:predicted nucleic acid-binding protein
VATTKPRVYVDAAIFVSVLKNEPTASICLAVLEAAERGDIQLIASRLLPVEVGAYKGDRVAIGKPAADDLVSRFLESVNAEWVELDVIVSREARRISWERNLRSADAIHLATAIYRKATHFMTLDEKFPLGTTIEGVEISLPRIVWVPTLLDGEQREAS